MKILITGYSAQHVNPALTGTFASIMARALIQSGHSVVQDKPKEYLQHDFDTVLIGVSSPVAAASTHSASTLALIYKLSANQRFFVDTPDLRTINAGHKRILSSPDAMKSDYLQKNRTKADKHSIEKHLDSVLNGAKILTHPNPYNLACLTPRHSWLSQDSLIQSLPRGCSNEIPVDLTPVLLDPDTILDLGMEAYRNGTRPRHRADIWVAQDYTTSRSKSVWIESTLSGLASPTIKPSNTRSSLSETFAQILLSTGVLEQPPSAITPNWWSPLLALSVAGGAYYATDTDTPAMPPHPPSPFLLLPAQFENLNQKQKRAVVDAQRDAAKEMFKSQTPDTITNAILAPPPPPLPRQKDS